MMALMGSEAPCDVSVVMSVYNGAGGLRQTLDSILAQRDVAFELVVIDDGSTDGSAAILDEYARRDARIRVIHQENRGLTRALVMGCAEARAPYIARHDCGDTSHADRLRKQKEALDRDPEIAFVSCWTTMVGPGGELLFTAQGTGAASEPLWILDPSQTWGTKDGPSRHAAVMFRADAYRKAGGYRPEFYYGQDWDLWYRLAECGKFRMIPEALYTASFDVGTISAGARVAQQKLAKLSLAAMKARAGGKSEADILRRAANVGKQNAPLCAEARGLYFIGEVLRRNDNVRARSYFLRAIRSCPLHAKAWLRLAQTLIR
jgi:glycosyltransferase involved in cell wall biosynthesis